MGIDLDQPIEYLTASLRFFETGEHHVTRLAGSEVLLLVYEGVLRFSEDGEPREVGVGEYYIQRRGGFQRGEVASDAPKYLYIHFNGTWSEGKTTLPVRGTFDYIAMEPEIMRMDTLAHGDYSATERMAAFYDILATLYRAQGEEDTLAARVKRHLDRHYLTIASLDALCGVCHYSKNHIINLFRETYGVTPFAYINDIKITKATYLLEVTSKPIEEIAIESGFNHYSHFYRLFVRKHGMTPFAWRRKSREKI